MPWPEHLVLDSKETADVDPSDGEYCPPYTATFFADNRIKICKEKQSCGHFPLNFKDVVDILARSYKIALGCIPQARKLASKHDIPFTRPGDYYAEMVKSDEHMERVRTKLVEEAYVFFPPVRCSSGQHAYSVYFSQGIKKSEDAKKQRDLKKFGKQIQHEKLRQREQDKKSFENRVEGLKRSTSYVVSHKQ